MPPKAKKTAKPKLAPQPKVERVPTKDELLEANKEGQERLDKLIDTLFICYDADEDGQIERVEWLDGEEKRLGGCGFGPKDRKIAFTWFKEAGATGTPADGMYLTAEQFKPAFAKYVAGLSEIGEAKPAELAEWLYENSKLLIASRCKPEPEAAPEGCAAGGPPAIGSTPPEYPITIPLRDLKDRLGEARSHGRAALVLASGLEQVETFFSYQMNSAIDCKQILNEVLIRKSVSKEEAQDKLREKLVQGMDTSGFCKPLWIRMANTAFDWQKFVGDKFPDEVFSGTLWTIENAHKLGFINEAQKMNVELEDEKKWQDFHVVITSLFDLDKANEYLFDKIPFYDELAIIMIDPASVD